MYKYLFTSLLIVLLLTLTPSSHAHPLSHRRHPSNSFLSKRLALALAQPQPEAQPNPQPTINAPALGPKDDLPPWRKSDDNDRRSYDSNDMGDSKVTSGNEHDIETY
ncbi:hypothetical protein V866_006789 [Kwoniella sp. B9012]